MTKEALEEAIRDVCDESGLSHEEVADVLDALKTLYQMFKEEEAP